MALQLSGSLQISGSVTAETIVLSSTASLAGTASWAINVVNGGGGAGFPYDGDAVITGSLSQGLGNTTVGPYSNAQGSSSWAIGTASHAEGRETFAYGAYSHTEGSATFTSTLFANIISIDVGNNIIEVTSGSFFQVGHDIAYVYNAGNNGNQVWKGTVAGVNDNYVTASGPTLQTVNGSAFWSVNWNGSTLFNLSSGSGNRGYVGGTQVTSSMFSHAEGSYNLAAGLNSHAEGRKNAAIGNHSHAEGAVCFAQGVASHAEGYYTKAIGYASHAEGGYTVVAQGDYSHAEGDSTLTIGQSSHAEGQGTIAAANYQHVQGKYNLESSEIAAFIIGNGENDGSRSNLVLAYGSEFQVTGSVISSVGFTGSLQGTASWAMNVVGGGGGGGSISTLGTTLYSTNPAAGAGFNTNNSIFFGYDAGYNANSSTGSNFLGYQAGWNAQSAWRSNFFGENAGYNSVSANHCNFIGFSAGYQNYGQHSNFIGTNAGYMESTGHYVGNANFIGQEAGYNAVGAVGSTFIGLNAGWSASYAGYSNFIGHQAGEQSFEASNSNFFGYLAGHLQTYASYSVFIGHGAGSAFNYAPVLGANNILIGTNVTLPAGYSNGINIGGLIFGSGSYSNPSLIAQSYLPTNGKVGINQNDPQYSLDVSGSIGLSDVLVLATRETLPEIAPTGSIMVSGSGADNKPYYWNGATWTALF